MKISRLVAMAGLAGSLLFSSLSFASAVNLGENDVAIHGYDPVAYFVDSKPVAGNAKYTATYEGAIYRFSSAKNRDMFKANAAKYAPQFGGYCAMGVALNKKLDIDPAAFYIQDDKLYLNLNKTVQKKWFEDVPGHIKTADRIWDGIEALSVEATNAEE